MSLRARQAQADLQPRVRFGEQTRADRTEHDSHADESNSLL